MSTIKTVTLLSGLAFAAGVMLEAAPALAMPSLNQPVPAVATPNPAVQNVVWVYVRAKHGPRYRAKRAGFGYYYGGYWYSKPWWRSGVVAQIGPVVVYNAKIHGPRQRAKHPGWIYHNGYWYQKRWW